MSRLNTAGVIALMAGLLSISLPIAAQERMRAGNYKMTTTNSGHTVVTRECVSAKDASNLNGDEKSVREKLVKAYSENHCTVKGLKIKGATLSMTTVCSGMSVETVTTYHGDSFEKLMTLGTKGGVQVSHTVGKRVGDCK